MKGQTMKDKPTEAAKRAAWDVSEAISALHTALDTAKQARLMDRPEPNVPGFDIEHAALLIDRATNLPAKDAALRAIEDVCHKAANGGTITAGRPARVSDLKTALRKARDTARATLE